MSLPTEGLQRRHYIDLVRRAYAKWVNWDPSTEIRIGSYGTFDNDTGVFVEEGNIYDPEFQKVLEEFDVKLSMANYPPEVGPIETDVVFASREIKEKELDVEGLEVPGIANAPIKSQWTFEKGKIDAVFAMHRPHQIFLPPRVVLEHLYQVDSLIDKYLVTVVHVTDAYTYYLSDKSGDTLSLALIPKAPAADAANATEGANATGNADAAGNADASGNAEGTSEGFTWWANAPSGILRHASDPTGKCSFMPIYSMRRPIRRIRRFFRDKIRPEPALDELWHNDSGTWEPLDEDGELDPLDPEVTAVDPFAIVEQEHLAKCDGCSACRPLRAKMAARAASGLV